MSATRLVSVKWVPFDRRVQFERGRAYLFDPDGTRVDNRRSCVWRGLPALAQQGAKGLLGLRALRAEWRISVVSLPTEKLSL